MIDCSRIHLLLFTMAAMFVATNWQSTALADVASKSAHVAICQKLESTFSAKDSRLTPAEIETVLRVQGCNLDGRAFAGQEKTASKMTALASADTSKATLLPPPPSFALNGFDPSVRSLFVAKDSINVLGSFGTLQREHGITLASPLGASVSGSIDQLKGTNSLTLQGYFGLCAFCGNEIGDSISYSIGPAAITAGSLTNPFKPSPITPSGVRVGPDVQFVLSDVFNIENTTGALNLDALPYYQTDFRGLARMSGIELLAEPTNEFLRLHSTKCPEPDTQRCLFGFTWRVVPEVDVTDVQNVGQTFYTVNRTYDWVGGNVQASAMFCQGSTPYCDSLPPPVLQFLSNLIPTVQYRYLTDAGGSGQTQSYFLGQLDYIIGEGKDSANGAATISASYISGTDEVTLQKMRQAKMSLNFKY